MQFGRVQRAVENLSDAAGECVPLGKRILVAVLRGIG
jgi:hypothetical protein